MTCRRFLPIALLYALAASGARADDFDRVDFAALSRAIASPDSPAKPTLTIADLGSLPAALRGTRSPLIAAKTDAGNLARMLVAPPLRKPAADGEPAPVLILERFETLDRNEPTTRRARGRDVTLFDGQGFDLDTGQVVPDGFGADLRFLARGEGGPCLVPLAGASLHPISKSPLTPAFVAGRPTPGRAVIPTDFSGRYRLVADGQFSGILEMTVRPDGDISGRFLSDVRGTAYAVVGHAGGEVPQAVRFVVKFPRSEQEFDGHLFTEGKDALAGTMTLLGRPYGFFAVREGASFAEGAK